MPEPKAMFDLLPEAYRSRGGKFLRGYLQIAEELLDDVKVGFGRTDVVLRELVDVLSHGNSSRGEVDGSSTSMQRWNSNRTGTTEGLVAWCRSRGYPPQVWPGLTIRSGLPDRLLALRTRRRAIVVAWTKRDVPEPTRGLFLPEELLPAGCDVQGIWIERAPRLTPVIPGCEFVGQLLFECGPGRERLKS